jgi:2-oxoglutarate dehydrogenase E2 component (dihydrolipoamide succinyltransferase)
MDVGMPDLGEGVSEGIIARWYKKTGDAVRAGEPLVDVETEKTTTEVSAPATGILGKIIAEEGAVAAVGSCIAVIREA